MSFFKRLFSRYRGLRRGVRVGSPRVSFRRAARRCLASPLADEVLTARLDDGSLVSSPPVAVVSSRLALSLPGLSAPFPGLLSSVVPCALIALLGVLIFSYPLAGEIITAEATASSSVNYSDTVDDIPSDEVKRIVAEADDYNERLYAARGGMSPGLTSSAALGYYDVLSIPDTDGVMCVVSVPSVGISLPVYHGTSSDVLSKGAGHMEQSSMPVGGESTHAVISAHNGLPGAKMFDDLPDVGIGDAVYISILDYVLKYEVVDINFVDPTDTSLLSIEEGRDLLSLITCYPPGINSSRLVVKCERVADDASSVDSYVPPAEQIDVWTIILLVVAFTTAEAFILWMVLRAVRDRRRWFVSRPCAAFFYAVEEFPELRLAVRVEEALGIKSSLFDWLDGDPPGLPSGR